MTKPDLIALAERLEAAKEGSRELDNTVSVALAIKPIFAESYTTIVRFPPITTSRDAIATLTEELLPGWMLHVWQFHVPNAYDAVAAHMWDGSANPRKAQSVQSQPCVTEPLARCAALLRALAEKDVLHEIDD